MPGSFWGEKKPGSAQKSQGLGSSWWQGQGGALDELEKKDEGGWGMGGWPARAQQGCECARGAGVGDKQGRTLSR